MKVHLTRLSCLLLTAFLGLGTFTGCEMSGKTKIRLHEVTHSFFYAPLYAAINEGFFEDEGLEVDLYNAAGAPNVMTGLLNGSADIGLMGPEAVVYAVIQESPRLPKVFGQLTQRDGSFLVSKVNIPEFDWATDLLGKHVLIGRSSGVPGMTMKYVLNGYGYSNTNMTMNGDVDFAAMVGAYLSPTGGVDMTTMFEPTASEQAEAGNGYILASVGEESGEVPYTAFAALDSYMQKNPEVIKGFLRAIKKGYTYMLSASDAEITAALKPSFLTTSDAIIVKAFNRYKEIGAWADSMVMKDSAFNRLLDIIDNAGNLTKRITMAEAVNNTYAEAVLHEAA